MSHLGGQWLECMERTLNAKAYNPYFNYVGHFVWLYRMQLRKITMYKCFFQPSWSPTHNYWQPTKALKNFYDHDMYLCHKVMTSSHMYSCLLNPSPSDSKRKYSAHTSVPSRPWCLGLFLLGFAGREQGWHSWLVRSLRCMSCPVWSLVTSLLSV